MKVYICKRGRDGDGKTYWDDVGLKVLIRDDGRVSVFDARTGNFYPAFEPKAREDDDRQQQAPAQQQTRQPTQAEPLNDEIPF